MLVVSDGGFSVPIITILVAYLVMNALLGIIDREVIVNKKEFLFFLADGILFFRRLGLS